ncbi:MAG: ACT domain-containing protein [Solirubrobacterales bacterium]|nr:ACT domain-containing protein [Solirubrobacterales bacterium]
MRLEVLAGELALCRLGPEDEVPEWAEGGELLATVRTAEELTVVCTASAVPAGVEASAGWLALRVSGTLDLALTGVLVKLLEPLAAAEVPIFAVSTYDTDYVLVPARRLDAASAALEAAGHAVERAP